MGNLLRSSSELVRSFCFSFHQSVASNRIQPAVEWQTMDTDWIEFFWRTRIDLNREHRYFLFGAILPASQFLFDPRYVFSFPCSCYIYVTYYIYIHFFQLTTYGEPGFWTRKKKKWNGCCWNWPNYEQIWSACRICI